MRFRLLASLLIVAATAQAQPNLWTRVSAEYVGPRLPLAKLSQSQFTSLADQLRKRAEAGDWGCDLLDDELRDQIRLESIPLARSHRMLLVEAGSCARGAQGANGAMWLVRLDPQGPVILAGPGDEFQGWLYSIQPSTSHGYHDLVLGWHMGAFDQELSYFRFDGKSYHRVGQASRLTDENGKAAIHSSPANAKR
jgi:hypothetical protein